MIKFISMQTEVCTIWQCTIYWATWVIVPNTANVEKALSGEGLGKLGNLGNLGSLGFLGELGKLGNLGSLGSLEELEIIENIEIRGSGIGFWLRSA